MSAHPDFIAVDWGTSNCRAVLVQGGRAVRRVDSLPGALITSRESYAEIVAGLRADLGDLPMVLSGMVGSTVGWKDADYCPTPVSAEQLATQLTWVDKRTAIIPGVSQSLEASPNVMRGEEVQIFGAVELQGEPNGMYCQPGTHSKWVQVEGGQIVGFHTSMTGEVFGLLKKHSILGPALDAQITPDAHFIAGVERATAHDALSDLFSLRAGSLLHGWSVERTTAFASGLLIGCECRARTKAGDSVTLVCDDNLAELYTAALSHLGVATQQVSARQSFLTGIAHIAASAFPEETQS